MCLISQVFYSGKKKDLQKDGLAVAQQLLKDKIAGDGKTVLYEFERLRRGDTSAAQNAERPENEMKNRYNAVLPFDRNRVCLLNNGNDYINASLIESKPGEQPHWNYIATQGPLKTTVNDFWLMVYQQHSNVIIMLTRTTENSHIEKCAPYFPMKENSTQRYGRFSVRTFSKVELSQDITVRELSFTKEDTGETRKVTHYYYHAWPDHGVPATTLPLRQLSDALRSTRGDGIPVVHCSAGIGRTGTFCAIDIVLRRLQAADLRSTAAAERAVDIKRVVTHLRRQRAGMVQTPGQYLFCHQAVKGAIDDTLGNQETPLSAATAQSPSE